LQEGSTFQIRDHRGLTRGSGSATPRCCNEDRRAPTRRFRSGRDNNQEEEMQDSNDGRVETSERSMGEGGDMGSAGRSAGRSNRGFASMDRERQREIASKGGRAAHRKGTAHQWSADEAREAGRKGGTSVSRDREHMAAIGREGGASAHRRTRNNSNGDSSQRS
jgi:general stress protein YciG